MSVGVGKNFAQCYKCVMPLVSSQNSQIRNYTTSGSTSTGTIENQKMQAKNIILNQWKLITYIKNYFSSDKYLESALNKEFAFFLQKIQPTLYGKDLKRFFETSTSMVDSESKALEERQKSSNGFVNVFNDLKRKISNKDVLEEEVPKWKRAKTFAAQELIASRTIEILQSLVAANSEESKLIRLEDLCFYLRKHPEAKHNAVKGGAIRLLLKIRRDNRENAGIQGCIGETLALLGYSDPVPGRGIRILSIDGGGVRGILVIEMLKKLEEYSGKPIHEMFDLICGVSTGAIIANLLSVKRKSLDEIYDIYKRISHQIFTQSTIKGTSNLVFSHSYYDTKLWESLLKKKIGEENLIKTRRDLKCPRVCMVSAVVEGSRLSAYLFRNYCLPIRVQSQYRGSSMHKVWEAVRASAAAPTYFQEFRLGGQLHQDGGILVNNPTAVAIHEARLLWPGVPLQCVMSFGTGRTAPNPVELETDKEPGSSTWKDKLYAVIESATDTEGVHVMLNDLLPEGVYYRFNPYLTEMLDIAEIEPEKLEQLERDALMYLRRNEDKFKEAACALAASKSLPQRVVDWISLQKEIQGFNIR